MKLKENPTRLNANENFYGCSKNIVTTLKKEIQNISTYPNYPSKLEEKLSKEYNLSPSNIVVGAGSVRLIDGIIQTFVGVDEEIIIFEKSFIAYQQLASAHKKKYIFAKQTDFVCSIENLFPLVNKKTKVIFIANPNNPTGTIITHTQLKKLLENISKNILVVIDEAYGEYVTDKNFPKSIELQKIHPNLIILRTFSKIYGLAGLRVGYAIANTKIANELKNSRIPFFFNSLSETAALKALQDKKFIKQCAAKNAIERDFLYENIKKMKFNIVPSQSNFLYIHFDSEDDKNIIFQKILQSNILICNLNIFGQDKSLRIGIGNRAINKKILKAIR